MKPRTYDFITNMSLLAAVLSALLFERSGNFGWLVGILGIAAGVTAASTYFYNQWKSERTQQTELVAAENDVELDPNADLETQPDFFLALRTPVVRYRYDLFRARGFWAYQKAEAGPELGFRSIEERVTEGSFLDWVVEIVDRLSTSKDDPKHEFVVSRDGKVTIRLIGRHRAVMRETTSLAAEDAELGIDKPSRLN